MRECYINNNACRTKWGYILTHSNIPPATAKTYKVDVVGMNGSLDYTDFFGDVKYDDIKIELEFDCELADYTFANRLDFESLNGQKVNITFSDMLDYYYVGRLNITRFEQDGQHYAIEANVVANPIVKKVGE